MNNAAFQQLYSRYAARLPGGKKSAHLPLASEIEGFKRAQRLAYECVVSVAAGLRPGDTEKRAAEMLASDLRARGVRTFLHRPFAWFGEHARFSPYGGDFHAYHPSDARLEEGMPFILDVSPIVDGYMGDVGYAVFPRETPEQTAVKKFLADLRAEIPKLFTSDLRLEEIWAEVDRRITGAGYVNCHALYPLRVLGHRVYRLGRVARRLGIGAKVLPMRWMGTDWFSLHALSSFASGGLVSELLTPENRGGRARKIGFWAIEPHVGTTSGFGAKFEEILAVEGDGYAFWIDETAPHVEEARRRGWATS